MTRRAPRRDRYQRSTTVAPTVAYSAIDATARYSIRIVRVPRWPAETVTVSPGER
jgi:hypothetical protein